MTAVGQRAFLGIYREALDTAHARGISVERIVIEHARFYAPHDADAETLAVHCTAVAGLAERFGQVVPSALQSLQRGRRTEIPYLTGYLADSATAIGLAAPLNKKLANMIEEIEAGQRRMSATNLEELPL